MNDSLKNRINNQSNGEKVLSSFSRIKSHITKRAKTKKLQLNERLKSKKKSVYRLTLVEDYFLMSNEQPFYKS